MAGVVKNFYRGVPTMTGPGTGTIRTLPASSLWQSIAYGNGTYVAMSYSSVNYCATSPDGITWTSRTLPYTQNWVSVAYGNGLFVAIGQGSQYATSPDGITWTARNNINSVTWNSITYGGGRFVAVGGQTVTSYAAYSPDGTTWYNASSGHTNSGILKSVTYGGGRYVAVSNYYNGSSTSKMIYSADGNYWTEANLGTASRWTSVAYGGGRFVAVGNVYTNFTYSFDGATWGIAGVPLSSTTWQAVTYGDGMFLAMGAQGQVAYSFNATTWFIATPNSNSSQWYSVVYGADKFVAVAQSSDSAQTIATIPYDTVYTVPTGKTAVLTGLDVVGGVTVKIDGVPFATATVSGPKQVLPAGSVVSVARTSFNGAIHLNGVEL